MSKKNAEAMDLKDYKPNMDLSKSGRVAHFLDFRAQSHPKEFLPYNLIAKAINQYKQMPRAGGKEADSVKNLMGQVKGVLTRDYGREVITLRGFGARASVDSTDTLEKVLTLKAQRLERSRVSFNSTLDLIDERKVVSGHYLKNWLTKSASEISKSLEAIAPKLALPAPPTVSDDKKE